MNASSDFDTSRGPSEGPPPSSPYLMCFVIAILGTALILLIVTDMIKVLRNQPIPPDFNTLTSLIAGGFIGFLTPHVASRGMLRAGRR